MTEGGTSGSTAPQYRYVRALMARGSTTASGAHGRRCSCVSASGAPSCPPTKNERAASRYASACQPGIACTGESGATAHQTFGKCVKPTLIAFCSATVRAQAAGTVRPGRVLATAAATCSEVTRGPAAAASCAA
jgi:hypothetical protein